MNPDLQRNREFPTGDGIARAFAGTFSYYKVLNGELEVTAVAEAASTRRSIFTGASRRVRDENFEDYWTYTLRHDGDILEDEQNLVLKKEILSRFQKNEVRSRAP